jgi:hypothetical protein
VIHARLARIVEYAVVDEEGRAERTTRVPRSRLNPEVFERAFADDPPVGDAVECDATRHAEILHAGLLVEVSRDAEHDLLGHALDTRRHIPVELFHL